MQYEDILTMTRGSHTLKFGGLYIRHRLNGYSAYPTRGNYTFNGQFASQIGSPSSSRKPLRTLPLGLEARSLARFSTEFSDCDSRMQRRSRMTAGVSPTG